MDVKTSPDISSDVNRVAIPERLAYPSDEARILLGGISEPKFRRLTMSGELATRKIGSRVYVEAEVLKAFIASRPSARTE